MYEEVCSSERDMQDIYEGRVTVLRCAVGVMVGITSRALSPFLFAVVMERLMDEVRQESLQTMMFVDDIVICSE